MLHTAPWNISLSSLEKRWTVPKHRYRCFTRRKDELHQQSPIAWPLWTFSKSDPDYSRGCRRQDDLERSRRRSCFEGNFLSAGKSATCAKRGRPSRGFEGTTIEWDDSKTNKESRRTESFVCEPRTPYPAGRWFHGGKGLIWKRSLSQKDTPFIEAGYGLSTTSSMC